jgi:hypothetical protein
MLTKTYKVMNTATEEGTLRNRTSTVSHSTIAVVPAPAMRKDLTLAEKEKAAEKIVDEAVQNMGKASDSRNISKIFTDAHRALNRVKLDSNDRHIQLYNTLIKAYKETDAAVKARTLQ